MTSPSSSVGPQARGPIVPAASVMGDLAGGLASAIPGLVYALTLGLLAYGTLGSAHIEVGLRAGFAAAVFGGVAAALASGIRLPATGPRASVTLVLTGFVLLLAQDRALGVQQVVALGSLCVMIAGAMQVAFGALRLGVVAKFVPYPVVAGFMCGIAVLIVSSQLHALGLVVSAAGIEAVHFGPLVVGAATALCTWLLEWRRPGWPAPVLGLLVGVALHFGLSATVGSTIAGERVGELPAIVLAPMETSWLGALLSDAATAKYLGVLLATSLVIAVIGSLDSLLAAVGIDAVLGTRLRANRELVAQGLGNITAGFFCGIPVALSPARAFAAHRAGGRTPLAAFVAAAIMALFATACSGLLQFLPLAVLAGVMLTIAATLVDGWTRALLHRFAFGPHERELVWSLVVVAVVATITIFVSFIVAVVVGVFLSMVFFIAAMNRSLVRAVYPGHLKPSRRIYGSTLSSALDTARRQIRVIELQGALFFGSTEKLGERVEALAAEARYLVLDLSRLTAIDATGAIGLERLLHRAEARATALLLAGAPGQRAQLLATPLGRMRQAPWFADADLAIEHAERALLGHVGLEGELPIERCALARGLDAAGIALLREVLTRIECRAGETLFREGDPGDTLYVLAIGAVTIVIGHPSQGDRRIVTFAPGAIFGEAAMLDGRVRSATATVADAAVLYALTTADLAAISARSPATTIAILMNLSQDLSEHLRRTTDTLRDLWDVRS